MLFQRNQVLLLNYSVCIKLSGMTEVIDLCWGGFYCPGGAAVPNPPGYVCPQGLHCPNGSQIYQVIYFF